MIYKRKQLLYHMLGGKNNKCIMFSCNPLGNEMDGYSKH